MKGTPAEGDFANLLRTPYAGTKPVEQIDGEVDFIRTPN